VSDLSQVIKNEARRLGFALAGFTTPDPPPHLSEWENWLGLGRHGQMKFMIDRRRAEPHLLLPGCRSILVLAARYPNPREASQTIGSGIYGRIASYAWGLDYHIVLAEQMKELTTFISTQVDLAVTARGYTDTGPLLERDLGQRAGLGWIGKNTCLIHPGIGSFFFLAEILLDVEIEPDTPFEADRCGTCTRCLDTCPTGALQPGRSMDARRCISYLTIENKGSIPTELRPLLGEWIFGCDLCQMACPWNHHARVDGQHVFQPRPGIPMPDLVAELGLKPQEFNKKFKDSPVQRARWRGYLRNVAVALGNVGGPEVAPALERAAREEDPLIREHVTWALKRILS
jgi:epoxyqueuosine reductase